MNNKKFGMFSIAMISTLVMLNFSAFAEEGKSTEQDSRSSLRGFPGVHVVVLGVNLPEEVGLTRVQLKTEAELKLRAEGIRVLTREEAIKTPGNPFLYVRVLTMESSNELYVYSIEVELRQWVSMLRDPDIRTYTPTWSTEVIGMTGAVNVKTIVRDAVIGSVDRFAKVYLDVNPERGI
jgi:hypothetical protein